MMRTNNFHRGFFGRMPFGRDADEMREKWNKMTKEEKVAFIDKRFEDMDARKAFSIEAIDQRCNEWMKKTPEEKEAFVKERKAAFEDGPFCGNERFAFGG